MQSSEKLAKDLQHTKDKKTTSYNSDLFGSDSDSTVEPDPEEWEKYFGKSLSESTCRSDQKKNPLPSESSKNTFSSFKVTKSRSKIHEISDSEEEEISEKHIKPIPSSSHFLKKNVDEKMFTKTNKLPLNKNADVSTIKTSKPTDRISLKRKKTETVSDSSEDEKIEKPLCKYGSKCYRKNPSHLEEFFHPGKERSKKMKTDIGNDKHTRIDFKANKSLDHSKDLLATSDHEVYDIAQPYSFFLTKVSGIVDAYNREYTMGIKDILAERMGNLEASCQFNYMFEIPWLVNQYPQSFRLRPLLIVHGFSGPSKAGLESEAAGFTNIRFCQARLDMPYGTHHTKMMFLLYDRGMRVVIHTSNLIERDWHQKTQGMWISPVFPKLTKPSIDDGESPTNFKHDLLQYVAFYKAYQLKEWKDHICAHDFSAARVVIIGSTPGRHADDQKHAFGHMKLRKVLNKFGPEKDLVKNWPVLGQFSSIGSLGATKENWLCTEWLQSLATVRGTSAVPLAATKLSLIFPTKENVRKSLEGYPAGASIPYSINVAKKQPYLHSFMQRWKSEGRGRSRAMPHIKTFGRPSSDGKQLAWFLVTSANLSKAAWGALEKKSSQLMIRSYEIGVMFLPCFFDKTSFPCTSSASTAASMGGECLVLPYDLPPIPHAQDDKPWIWDIQYRDLPDCNGNMWCPS